MDTSGGPAQRLCSACDKTVHDLSAMRAEDARALLASGPACVRYLYDASGKVLRAPLPAEARIVPASALLTRAAKSKWLAAAMMAASAIVFEACGGNNGMGGASGALDEPKRPGADPRPGDAVPDAGAGDAASDATDVDANDVDASDPDAGP